MIYLSGLIEDEKGLQVTYQHHKPELLNKTNEELLANGVLVNALPVKENIEGKIDILYLDKVTKEPFYVYEDKPLTKEEEMAQLQERLALTEQALNDLIMGGLI